MSLEVGYGRGDGREGGWWGVRSWVLGLAVGWRGKAQAMTGENLRQLLLQKWGCSYDIRLRRTQGKIFVLVMWRYLEQASFPLSEADYLAHLNAIVNYLQAWGSVEQVVTYIQRTREKPRLGKAVSIPLDLGDRASEWIIED